MYVCTIEVVKDVLIEYNVTCIIMQSIKLSNKTILVTGAAGFIGSFLSKKLLESFEDITPRKSIFM